MDTNTLWLLSLVIIAYKTVRALRSRVTAALAVVSLEAEQVNRLQSGAPATAAADEDSHERTHAQRMGQAARDIVDSEARTDIMLKFWVLFGLLHCVASFGYLPYVKELRAVVLILGLLPVQTSYRWLEWCFASVAAPICGQWMPRLGRWAGHSRRMLASWASPVLRTVLRLSLSTTLLGYMPPAQLEVTRLQLEGMAGKLTQERRGRRMRALQRGMPRWGAIDEGDEGEDDDDGFTLGAAPRGAAPSLDITAAADAEGDGLRGLPGYQRHYLTSPRDYAADFEEADGSGEADEWTSDYLDADEVPAAAGAGGLSAGTGAGGGFGAHSTRAAGESRPATRAAGGRRSLGGLISGLTGAGGSSSSAAGLEAPDRPQPLPRRKGAAPPGGVRAPAPDDGEDGAVAAVGGLVSSLTRGVLSALGGTPRAAAAAGGAAGGAAEGAGRLAGGGAVPASAPHMSRAARYRQSTGGIGLGAGPGSAQKRRPAGAARTLLWSPQMATAREAQEGDEADS